MLIGWLGNIRELNQGLFYVDFNLEEDIMISHKVLND